MTHEELSRQLEGLWHDSYKAPGYMALRAIVELHNPELHQNDNVEGCVQCSSFSYRYVEYPCPTIQAIEKELS